MASLVKHRQGKYRTERRIVSGSLQSLLEPSGNLKLCVPGGAGDASAESYTLELYPEEAARLAAYLLTHVRRSMKT